VPSVALGVLAWSLLARAPQGMAPLALILLVQERTGSIAAAGLASGAWGLGIAVGQPLWARPAGRGRADLVVTVMAVTQALVLAVVATAPWTTTGVAVALAGAAGLSAAPVTSVARTLWPQLAPRPLATDRLFTLDATAQEVIWIAGPAVVGVLVAVSGPTTALLITALAGGMGGVLFGLAVRPLWQPRARPRSAGPGVVRLLLLPYLGLWALALGLGLSEVAVPAAAIVDGQRDAAGWLLAVWSLGSLVGGLTTARWPSSGDPARRIPWFLLGITLGGALTALTWTVGLGWLGLVLFLSGLGLAPAMAATYGVVARTAPEHRRTEAFAVGTTFILVGLAVGSALGGALAAISPTWAFAVGTCACLVATLLWLTRNAVGQRTRSTRPSSQTGSSDS